MTQKDEDNRQNRWFFIKIPQTKNSEINTPILVGAKIWGTRSLTWSILLQHPLFMSAGEISTKAIIAVRQQ